ncbi:ATP-binding protein [Paenibacillus sp. Marseille-Q4541]|uniref:ATP-binding protein n=1 Tax=Paenibacillus sp. Marseille-Q4541 TaxID=2831522 RepID=UPI001BA9FAF9|nr:ATP-binding protein [Paenibacillus sp. Marseille-Q4541]
MTRIVVITVGKTHSGKTTFARALEQKMHNSLVIDQDNHAEFINTHYRSLQPKQGPNTIKYVITQTIVDYAVHQTDFHLILCNSNRVREGRVNLLAYFRDKGFRTILVNFDLSDHVLEERVAISQRSTNVFRSASTFEEVLIRQQTDSHNLDEVAPSAVEADQLFVIQQSDEVHDVIQKIVNISRSL